MTETLDRFARSAFVRDETPCPFADRVRPIRPRRLDAGDTVAKPSGDLFAGAAVVVADREQTGSDADLDGIPV